MIVYNTTFHIDNDILADCLQHLKTAYLPNAVRSGFLQYPVLRRVLNTRPEEGNSYSVQFHVKNMETLEYWMEQEGKELQQELLNRFSGKIVGFTTLLEELDWENG